MLKNIIKSVSRSKFTATLNILGLTIAFTAFMVIMMQVRYANNYDAFHKDADRIYRFELSEDSLQYSPFISRPLGEEVIRISPYIELGTPFKWGWNNSFRMGDAEDKENYNLKETFFEITPDFIKIFDFQFVEGSGDCIGGIDGVIISQTAAKRLFPNESAMGKEIVIKGLGRNLKIGGVFKDFPKNSFIDNAIFYNISDLLLNDQSEWSVPHYVKLTDHSRKDEVEEALNIMVKEKYKDYPKVSARLHLVRDIHFAQDCIPGSSDEISNRNTIRILFGIAILIVVIAAINFLNFAMAMTPIRLKSINVHKILGSTTVRLRVLLVGEALIMVLLSYGLAILFEYYLASTFVSGMVSADMSIGENIELIIITGIVAIVTGFVAGIFPALYSTSFQPALVLKGAFGMSPKGRLFRTVLISLQYVISMGLIICSMMMMMQNRYMKNYPMGFNKDNILSAYISGTVNESREAFINEIKSNPIIKDIAFSRGQLVAQGHMGWGRMHKGERVNFSSYVVSWNFLKFMGMEIVEGRDFREEDELKERGTIIFNQKAVDQYGFVVGEPAPGHNGENSADMVGVVKNFNFMPLQYGIEPIALYVFGEKGWWPLQYMNVRVDPKDTEVAIEYIKNTIRKFDPKYIDIEVQFMDESIGRLYEKEENLAKMISLAGLLSMFISLVGVFGLIMFETQYRRREIGLRKINGATVGSILSMFNRKFVVLVTICFAIAAPLAWFGISKWLENFAYRTPIHWWVFALALVIVLLVTVLTVTVQSWRAATENPVKSIKSE